MTVTKRRKRVIPSAEELYPPRRLRRLLKNNDYSFNEAAAQLTKFLCREMHTSHGWNCKFYFDDACPLPEEEGYRCRPAIKAKAYVRKGLKEHHEAIAKMLRRPSGQRFPTKWMTQDPDINRMLRRYPRVVDVLNYLWHESSHNYEACRALARQKTLFMEGEKVPVLALAPTGRDIGASNETTWRVLAALTKAGAVRNTQKRATPRGRHIYIVGQWVFDKDGEARRHPLIKNTPEMRRQLAEMKPFFGQKLP